MKERLSRVFLDGYPITLMGDEAVPPLSRIVRAGGKHPDRVDVLYLTSPSDLQGRAVAPDELIDRTVEPTRPIYLRTAPRDVRPIHTVHPEPDVLPASSDPLFLKPKGLMSNVDPVIAQLGRDPPPPAVPARPPHEEGVFRSPSSTGAAAVNEASTGSPERAGPSATGMESLADAEAAAEQRQEDERNQEDALQDEQEELSDAEDDADSRQ